MTQSVLLTTDVWISGTKQTSGSTISVDDGLAGELVASRRARYVIDPMASGSRNAPARFALDINGEIEGLSAPNGELLMQFVDVGGSSSSASMEV